MFKPLTKTPLFTPISDDLKEELFSLRHRQAERMPYAMFVIGLVMVYLAFGHIHNIYLACWASVFLAFHVFRVPALNYFLYRENLSIQYRINIEILLCLLAGFIHSMSLLVFSELSAAEQSILSMVVLGMCSGVVFTTAGYFPMFMAYVLPMFSMLILAWSTNSFSTEWNNLVIIILLCTYFLLLIGSAKESFGSFKESFEIRLQKNQLNQQLELALADAKKSNIAKTRFLASASHDLRQPVQTLGLYISALSMKKLDESNAGIAKNMQVAIGSLSTQLDALLDISKLDAGIILPNVTSINLSRLLNSISAEISPLANEKSLSLTFDIPEQCYVSTDEALLGRIIRNILDNAIKYTQQGSICLSIKNNNYQYLMSIEDTGYGIPDDQKNQVFDEFYQLHNPERDRTKGLGLGLSIVKRLCDLLNIPISMASELGRGTCFEFQLTKAMAPSTKEVAHSSTLNTLKGIKILIIDDEFSVATAMQTLLYTLNSEAVIADGIETALQLAKQQKPDIVLADFRLRGNEDGISAIQQIRILYPNIPAILVSGDTAPERLLMAKNAKIPLLSKPVSADVFVQSINQLL